MRQPVDRISAQSGNARLSYSYESIWLGQFFAAAFSALFLRIKSFEPQAYQSIGQSSAFNEFVSECRYITPFWYWGNSEASAGIEYRGQISNFWPMQNLMAGGQQNIRVNVSCQTYDPKTSHMLLTGERGPSEVWKTRGTFAKIKDNNNNI